MPPAGAAANCALWQRVGAMQTMRLVRSPDGLPGPPLPGNALAVCTMHPGLNGHSRRELAEANVER